MMKLVRHGIPEDAWAKGEVITLTKVKGDELKRHLAAKLVEEAREFLATPNIEELADVVEVITCLQAVYSWADGDVKAAGNDKRFLKGTFLIPAAQLNKAEDTAGWLMDVPEKIGR